MDERTDLNFWQNTKVLVTGGAGFLGSYIVDNLIRKRNVPTDNVVVPRSCKHDLRDPQACACVVRGCQIVIHLAAVTGGIGFSRANPASQYRDSTLIDLNVIEAARAAGVKKLVAVGNLFAYAGGAPMPLKEESLFEGLPAGAHRGVGWMKRNLAVMADLYQRQYGLPMVVVYSANVYGPRDSTDPARAHVIPATIMKCLRDDELVVWGDGTPTRDFLFASDAAEGILLAAERLRAPQFVNISSETEISMRELVESIARLARFRGRITYDVSKSGGDTRRFASSARAREWLGCRQEISIEEGLRRTIDWYRERLGVTAERTALAPGGE
jgi:GDP-L-fucose synthase